MHIPDGFLSPPVWTTLDVISVPAVAWAAKRAGVETDDRKVPLLGVMGAFVFAAQMINFPVGLGTSGHLLGGALLAMVLGPASAIIVMTAILALQAFVFQDGGILALGVNLFNMALVGVGAGYLPYRLLRQRWRSGAIFLGGTLSVLAAACLALTELLLSGVRMSSGILGVSLGLFTVSALLEGAITLAAFQAIERLRPDSIRDPARRSVPALGWLAATAVILAVFGILIASAAPDGIQQLAQTLGLQDQTWIKSPFAGYQAGVWESQWTSRAAAGLAGLAMIWALCVGAGRFLARKSA